MRKNRIGILAYGSLIVNPGKELQNNIADIKNVITPFKVEFARKSRARCYAPTLIPVKKGGAKVKAKIFILKECISRKNATDMLYRREIYKICSDAEYEHSDHPGPNKVVIKMISNFHGEDIVLYTEIGKNIDNLSPEELAKLAIRSACSEAGIKRKDGINYLIGAKKNGIKTPLIQGYEEEILRQTNTKTLQEAWEVSVNERL